MQEPRQPTPPPPPPPRRGGYYCLTLLSSSINNCWACHAPMKETEQTGERISVSRISDYSTDNDTPGLNPFNAVAAKTSFHSFKITQRGKGSGCATENSQSEALVPNSPCKSSLSFIQLSLMPPPPLIQPSHPSARLPDGSFYKCRAPSVSMGKTGDEGSHCYGGPNTFWARRLTGYKH